MAMGQSLHGHYKYASTSFEPVVRDAAHIAFCAGAGSAVPCPSGGGEPAERYQHVDPCEWREGEAWCHCRARLRDHPQGVTHPTCNDCFEAGRAHEQRRCADRAQGDELAPLRERMTKGRRRYPEGCTFLSLQDEVGEAAHALNKREPVERVRDEILDAAGVAMRLYLGEVDAASTLEGLVQLGARCRGCRAPVAHGIGRCASCADAEGS